MFKEGRQLLADKQTHRLVPVHAENRVFIEERNFVECSDGQVQNLAIKPLLSAKMIINRCLIDICALRNLAHRGPVKAIFGKGVGRMIKECLAGDLSYFGHYNFLATEVRASPMGAALETTREFEAEMIFWRLVASLIPYWRGRNGFSSGGSDATV